MVTTPYIRTCVDVLATLDAIRRLDQALVDCEGPTARAIVHSAMKQLELDLRQHLTGGPRQPIAEQFARNSQAQANA